MELVVNRSVSGLWWPKVGKWQVLAVVVTWLAFFIAVYITGDIGKAAFVALITAIVASAIAFITASNLPNGAFAVAVVVVFTYVSFAVAYTFITAVFIFAVAYTIYALAFTFFETRRIDKKTILSSYAAEFLFILIPILTRVA